MNNFNRFLRALGAGLLWGTIAAVVGGGLYTFFWMLAPPVRLGVDKPFANIPLFDAILLIAAPVAMFLVGGGIAFYHTFKEPRSSLSPGSCA